MLSLFSTLGGLLISGLPKLLDFFQNKNDQKHELALAQIQVEMQLQANWLTNNRLPRPEMPLEV